jgi:hypothetical protein
MKYFNSLNIPLTLFFTLTVFTKEIAPISANTPKIIIGKEAEQSFSFLYIFSTKNVPIMMPMTVLETPGEIPTENGNKMMAQ